ncbi:MAG: dihydrodipicolinate synthase/N-acetylneuraminate lyase, partial [Flavobacteriales bacterium]
AVKVYPNPSTGLVHISVDQTEELETLIEIINTIGEVIYHKSNGNRTEEVIDLSQHARGLYFLKVTSDNQVRMRKILLQ